MEIEAKFRVADPGVFADLEELPQIGDYRLVVAAAASEQQRNTYYDTADHRLAAAHYGLRIREVAGQTVVTLKGPNEGKGSLHQRSEWEFPGADPDPHNWADGPARRAAVAVIGDAPLEPLVTVQTDRRKIVAYRDAAAVAEISLDACLITAGTRTTAFRELELELLAAGQRANLDELITLFQERYPLAPEHRSKLQCGLELLAEQEDNQ